MMTRLFICIATMLTLAACTSGDRGLRDLRASGGGPDEFRVMPMAPLVLPADTATLPTPTPGAGNRADPAPIADAVVALGGSANALVPNGVPVRDGALVAAASRNGVDPAIRQTLASEDEAFRTRQSRFGFFRGRDRYFRAYARQALDAYAELTRFRNAGVATPSAPPQ
ncbi:DUF3035 domain-containing protein [Octadecabacter sp. G9-8]|uniref:DUF3035 domain-containing protein n=1 Tax=Octadecabacter dasysiphoniae TaxID=2909341 RepID=A0ABS9CXZ2_9RHOB|nr:DUF3035 domain-containing protein [Octadecabacter dasysiphoniae]MCF2871275.1 DUF3035 domain-containing protein [Octadecabacter dasysiphoniae]